MIPIRSFSRSDVGLKRDNNEDSFLADDESGLYIVADGMGGHAAGEVASKQVVDSVRAGLAERWAELNELAVSAEPEARAKLEGLMQAAVLRACKEVHLLARKDARRHQMGSTCVALLCVSDKAVIGHVGDSRVYLFRAGALHRLTEDHTLGAEQVRRGFITEEEMHKLPTKNILLRAVGLEPAVAVDTLVTDLYPGDSLLLCSDGLYGDLTDEEVSRHLSRADLSQSAALLVDLANERGGKDNSTAVVLSVGDDSMAHTDVGSKVDVLRSIPLFAQLNYRELLELLSISATRKYAVGQEIVREGEQGFELFAITRGKVEVVKGGQSIAQLGPGGYFGEMVMFDDSP
ncbi:MAG: protein phosphatase 2C domain-containing protein, partial [Deltaproteobacteria bacterium]|nr:protein phosphatase 2C domain-containing protein [Deltaproteobacteria bacterium]